MADTRTGPRYEIRLRGVLGQSLLSAFPTLRAQARDGTTVLSGPIADQAALHGVLAQVESLGLELLGVSRIDEAHPGGQLRAALITGGAERPTLPVSAAASSPAA